MKIFVSADMEGVEGVTHPAQCRPTHPDYARFRKLLTEEINAAVAGAVEAGATEVVVNDAHFTMTNVLLEDLHPSASLISGSNKLLCQMEGLDDSFAGVFFVGYHEGDGAGDGVINHTLMSAAILRVSVDGVAVDEAMINARVAGCFSVPVGLITGDDRVCATASNALPGIEVAPVKRAIDRLSAEHRSATAARELIRERAAAAVRTLEAGNCKPVDSNGPCRFEVEFRSTSAANICTLLPGVERVGPCRIGFEHDSYLDAYRHFWAVSILGMSAQDGIFGTGL
jgi:D-amino peptidase